MSGLKQKPNRTVEPVHPRHTWLQTPADGFREPKENSCALPKRPRASVGRLFFMLTPAVVVFGLGLSSNSWAQTEVEGEVSGVWDTDGSPYVLVGDANVPEDESLTIQPGVEVVFGENLTLTVNGHIRAVGTDEDTIQFHGSENMVTGSLRLTNDQDTIRFQYCRFDSLREAIQSDNRAVNLTNCRFVNNWRHLDLISDYVYVTNCHFTCADTGDGRGSIRFGTPNRRNGTYIMIENEIQTRTASIHFNWADNAEFIGNAFNSNMESRVSWLTFSNDFNVACTGNTGGFRMMITNSFRRLEAAIFENNEALSITVTDQANWGVVIRNNVFKLGSALGSTNTMTKAEFYDNTLGDRLNIYCDIESEAILDGNLISGMEVRGNCDVNLFNNTILEGITEYLDDAENISITAINNIFASFDLSEFLIDPAIGEVSGGYNCFWGAEQPYGADRDLLDGDIVADPRFVGGHPYEYQLQANSPCIDAGNPDSPEDPDGTRADIGAYFYDQENGMPPAIISRHDAYTGWGMDFRYVARATDWDGAIEFEFEGLPEWLQVEEDRLRRDFVSDTAVVSGRVPQEQEDFVFVITARDEDGLDDTLSVQVFVYPMTVLTGRIGGLLTREGSPYIVADTAWVAEDDSLVIEPGCEVFFANERYEDRWGASINVYGNIRLAGTEQDSIVFDKLPGTPGSGYLYVHGDSNVPLEFRYCGFKDLSIRSRNNRDFVIAHCRNDSGGYVMGGEGARFLVEYNLNRLGSLTGGGIVRNNSGNSSLVIYSRDTVNISNNHWQQGRISLNSDINLNTNILENNIIDSSLTDRAISLSGGNFICRQNMIGYCNQGIRILGNDRANIIVANNLINNSARYSGLHLIAGNYSAKITNNVVANSIRAIWLDPLLQNRIPESLMTMNNLLVANDSIFHNPQGIEYDAFSYNAIYDFDSLGINNWIGENVRSNANGDSCDAGFNVFLDPQIVGLDSLDFRLYASSPLIDAGNPDSSFNDLDGTINDIGLFGGPYGESYDYPVGVGDSDVPPPEGFTLSQPHPNPFNSQVQFTFTLPKPGGVGIKVYDVTGRLVLGKDLAGLAAGSHQYVWKGEDNTGRGLPTGIYYFELAFERAKMVRPMVMVK